MDRNLLARATEGTDAPTPGYLYNDLTKAVLHNPSACQETALYLTRRLSNKQNPNIKYKCLKVIAKLCDQVPRNSFRRCLAQDPNAVASIKAAMAFRGPLDPVQGDSKNERVRVAAKEALDAVYREAPMTNDMGSAATGGVVSSYGASPYEGNNNYNNNGYGGPNHPDTSNGYGGGDHNNNHRMQGIGNPRYTDPRHDPRYNSGHPPPASKLAEHIKEAGEVVLGMIKDPLAKGADVHMPPRQGHSGNLPGYGGGGGYGRPPPGQSELSRQTGGQWTMASNRGPGAIQATQPPSSYNNSSSDYRGGTGNVPGQVGGSWGGSGGSGPSSVVAGQAREPAFAANNATTGGGFQQQPHSHHHATTSGPTTTMRNAAASDGSYEKNLILELCPAGGMKPVPPPDKLASFGKVVASLNPDLICPVLLDCLEDGQPWIIRAKALCVMEVCVQHGGAPYYSFLHACSEEIVPLSQHPRGAIKDPARRILSLLGVSEAEMAASAPPPTAFAAATPMVPTPNLLDFDDAPPPPTSSHAPPAVASPAAPPGNNTMFGGMQVKSATSPVAAATAKRPEPAPTSGNLLDFMSDGVAPNNNDVFRESEALPNSLFDQMALKDEDKKTDSHDAGDMPATHGGANTGSAFGFINGSDSPKPQQPPSFDPLVNLTPKSAEKKVMALSTEQMQAMAYQQLMMQQQQMHMMAAMQQQQQQQQQGVRMPQGMLLQPAGGAAGGRSLYPPMPGMPGMPVRQASTSSSNSGFNFMGDARPVKQDDKKFDFVKDAMQSANKK